MAINQTCDDTAPRSESTRATLLAAVVTADHMINSLMALRATLIDQLRTDALDPGELALHPGDPDLDLALGEVTAELACALHLPQTSAAHLLDDAHTLATDLPATATALAEGTITYHHAQTMVTVFSTLDPGQRARAETILVPKAKVMTGSAFTRAASRTRNRLDPTPLAVRHTQAATGRTVHLTADLDGMAWLHAHLPATTATAIFNRLTDAAATLQHPDDPRTLPQLRADTFAAVMLDNDAHDAHDAFTHAMNTGLAEHENACGSEQGGAASSCTCDRDDSPAADTTDSARAGAGSDDDDGDGTGTETSGSPAGDRTRRRRQASTPRMRQTLRGIRPTVAVTVPVLTLLGGDAPAELEGYGPIDPQTARELCAGAPSFLRILTHPHTGAILGIDRDRYTVPADLKSWLRLRDETCRFPGCARRAQRCDIDHVTNWAHGGTTDQTNLIHLCRKHHRLRHRTKWNAQIITTPPQSTPDGSTGPSKTAPTGPLGASVRWTAPSGRTYTTTDALTGRGTDHDPSIGSGSPPGPDSGPATEDTQGNDPPTDPLRPEPPARFPDIPPF